jgi:hypothetical protein
LPDEVKAVAPYTLVADQLRATLREMLSLYGEDMNQGPAAGSGFIHRILLALWRAYNPEIFGREQRNIE